MEPLSILLALGGFLISIFAVLVGGAGFLSTPLLQMLLPGSTLGVIIGNARLGSVFRGISSVAAIWSLINLRKVGSVIAIAAIGAILGAWFVSDLDQRWLIPILVLAIIVTEAAPWLANHISERMSSIGSFLTGVYMGVFGAGTALLLIALLRIKQPSEHDIASVRAQALFIEFVLGILAAGTYAFHGQLSPGIWVPYSVGAVLGGLVGGMILKHTAKLSGSLQKLFLRASYVLALLVSACALLLR